jgi:hypothetical protein
MHVTNAEKSILPTAHIDDARMQRERLGIDRVERAGHLALANAGVRIAENEVWGTSKRVFGSPHLPVPMPRPSADDEPIEPCDLRDVIVATAWIIAWALTVFILANVIGSI